MFAKMQIFWGIKIIKQNEHLKEKSKYNVFYVKILVQIVAEDRRLFPYIAYFLFALIMVTFSWSTEEPHHLRIEMTFLTTILIAIGEYYEVAFFIFEKIRKVDKFLKSELFLMEIHLFKIWILSNALMNYIGNISYSLYLVHWPIFATIKYFAPDNNLGNFKHNLDNSLLRYPQLRA